MHPKTRYGQNFLIDLNLQHLLIEAAELTRDDVVLEVGTGTASLSVLMAPQVAALVTVEVDTQLHQLASETLADLPHVDLLRQDILKNKNTLNPEVLRVVTERVREEPGRQLKLVANLPYNVATPIISNLLLTEIVPCSMTITIQKELADRIMASPRSKDYSALSVWLQSQCRIELIRVLPPTVFWPRPKVSSAIIRLTLEPERRREITELRFFHDFVRAIFLHRRKFLRGVLVATLKPQLDKPAVDDLMASLAFGETTRAEELDVPAMLRLAEAVRARLPQASLTQHD
ncbi:MAG: ribosomal RNA small subunit methyltransferase A [Pirellulales bacterium]|nr:ribosomal RNA small subunit methyltransferase A [Pirellulales bacterium]